ncbi:MAG: 5-nucleotidase, cytosolic III-like protein [uncultured bacterium (gcode 4)]|uniref:5'-nucleotidase n=1 Tax=uncultured bacterium (gcode 4) TaxID=1234023 RepID=K2G2J6_9BACT|nr:MAG: 5-nucleotidase, cytosolic III-like protein [uncultured bacterium (gcode 4)]
MQKLLSNPKIFIKDDEAVKSKINKFRKSNLQIVADFDSTITQDNGYTSWSLFWKTGMMPEEYNTERNTFFEHYYPFEIDATLSSEEKDSLMKEWWMKHLDLFIKYRLHFSVIDMIIQDSCLMDFRHGMRELIDYSAICNVPFIILSAWLTNTISEFLDFHEAEHSNLHITSNELKFNEEWFCIGMNKDMIIHSENKDEQDMPERVRHMVEWKNDIILIWDSLSDVKMIAENLRPDALKIWFISDKKIPSKEIFLDTFDIVIESNHDSFDVPFKILEYIK